MKNLRIFVIVTLLVPGIATAAETVLGNYTSTCWNWEKANDYAPTPSYSKIKQALSCSKVTIVKKGVDNCKSCSNGGYKCRGYAVAYCK